MHPGTFSHVPRPSCSWFAFHSRSEGKSNLNSLQWACKASISPIVQPGANDGQQTIATRLTLPLPSAAALAPMYAYGMAKRLTSITSAAGSCGSNLCRAGGQFGTEGCYSRSLACQRGLAAHRSRWRKVGHTAGGVFRTGGFILARIGQAAGRCGCRAMKASTN